jgi:hypothetical protein
VSACKSRHHVYVDGICKKCRQPYRPPGRPRKVAGPEGSARLAATLGVPAPAASSGSIFSAPVAGDDHGKADPIVPDQVLPPAKPEEKAAALEATATAAATATDKAADDEEKKRARTRASKKLWAKVSHKLTKVFLAATDAAVEAFDGKDYDREPGDADDEDVEDFEEAVAIVLADRFPDVELGAGAAAIFAGAMIVGDKCLGSTKVPKAKTTSISGDKKPETVPEGTPATQSRDDAPAAGSTSALTLLPSSRS